MPAIRPVLFLFVLGLAVGSPALHAADTRGRFVLLERTQDGRDSVRTLGDGEAAHVAVDGRGGRQVAVVDPEAVERWIVTLTEPAGMRSFAEAVRARRAIVDAFGPDLARRLPPRTSARGPASLRIVRTYDRLLAGVVLEATEASANAVRALPGVRSVTRDIEVKTQDATSIHQVHADQLRNTYGVTGRGVRVGIVDTGIDYHHPALGGGFGPGYRVVGGWDVFHQDADPLDDNGHGTHVAGIVGGQGDGVDGMAPGVTFYAYKVLDEHGSGYLSQVIEGLERCADPDQDPATADQLDVVNMSLGGWPVASEDAATEAVDALDALGTTVVVAAGNNYLRFVVGTPGLARGALTVGSVSSDDILSAFSSRGPTLDFRIKPDVLGPGENIVSAARGGGTVALSGTSMATPHVTGAVALLRELHPEWTRDELRAAITSSAQDLGRISSEQGSGRLDVWNAGETRVFLRPTSLAFGRVPAGSAGWARSETLHVHTRSDVDMNVTLALTGSLPAGLDATLDPAALVVPHGGEAISILTLRALQPLHLPEPLYIAEGVVEVRSGTQVRRVPFSVHECVQVDLRVRGGFPVSAMFGDGRSWPGQLPFGSTFLLPPGTYDALSFSDGNGPEPFYGLQGVRVLRDTLLTMESGPPPSQITFQLEDERRQPLTPPSLSYMLLHSSGGGLGVLGGTYHGVLRLPAMSSAYRLEWKTGVTDTTVLHDIPGTVAGPLVPQIVRNDPAKLRRLVEHVHVAAGDSLLSMEFALMPDGEDGWWGPGFYDRLATPHGESYDVVRWTAPTPSRRHVRFGHQVWTLAPARARSDDPNPFSGIGATWEQDLGDSLAIRSSFQLGPAVHGYRGHDLPLGSGAASYRAMLNLSGGTIQVWPFEYYTSRWFRDASGASASGPAAEYELARGGTVIAAGVAEGEDRVFEYPNVWSRDVPGVGPFDVTLRSRGWQVAGRPSVTTVRARLDESQQWSACVGPEWFAVVANGGPVERIAFGQHRDPHVEMTLPTGFPATATVAIDYRGAGAWTTLPITRTRDGREVRAALPAMLGEISLRVRFGAWGSYYTPMLMEIVPAYVGEPSQAAHAQVLEARATLQGAHVEWRVGAPGAQLLVERREAAAAWSERGELTVADDGIARFDDPDVVAGHVYGYRLGGSSAEVFVTVPGLEAGVTFAVSPNPSVGDVQAAVFIASDEPVRLSLLDLQGRVVASRTYTGLALGVHVLPLASRGRLPAGLYFARMQRGAEIHTRRVTLLQ